MHSGDTLCIVVDNTVLEKGHEALNLASSFYSTWIPPVVSLIGVFGLALILVKTPIIKRVFIKHIKYCAIAIWISGFFLYAIGFNDGGSTNPLTLCLRATLSSLEMFVSHSDLLEVKHICHSDTAYMMWFSITHFLAVFTSAIFIIRILGLRIMSKILLWLHRWLFSCKIWPFSRKNLFVFWGVNKNSIITAKSLVDKYNKNNICIIFVNLPEKQHMHSSRFSFSHFFHTSSEGVERYVADIENMEAFLVNANKPFVKNVIKDKNIFKALGIKNVDRLVSNTLNTDNKKVEYFFLSDNEEENLSAIVALKSAYKDTNDKNINNKECFKCYCHARKNSFNTALLECDGLRNKIYLVDSSSLSILPLKKDVDNHPISFVDKNTEEGYVMSNFTAMVIGFGEAGRDAFRFLYEFASFPCDKNGTESPKRIYIVDEKLKHLKGDFLNDAPALKNKSSRIQWWNDTSTHSECFWAKLGTIINSLNYIVITVGNDEEAQNLAVDLFEYAYRYRKDTNKFKIYVRLRDYDKHSCLKELKSSCIIPFGENIEIFSYETISVDAVEEGAMKFYYGYKDLEKDIEDDEACAKKKKEKIEEFRDKPLELWYWRRSHNDPKKENPYYTKRSSKDNFIELYYQEEQDKSNFWHIKTKRCLAGLSKKETKKDHIKKGSSLFKNLSRCEHLRWNAKMELLGFVHDDAKNYKKRTHHSIIECIPLESKYPYLIPYDDKVVELSFDDEFDDKD